jgi:glutamyl-Q tRNA(Asp) synthetase
LHPRPESTLSCCGRFAPSPTGPLHAGSLVAALASWLDVRARGGRWLVRIEDLDRPRCLAGCDRVILEQLQRCGLLPDEATTWQSARQPRYDQALQQLIAQGDAYPCSCTRQQIDRALADAGQHRPRHGDQVYPGTCRHGLQGRTPRAWRLLVGASARPTRVDWIDRRLGPQTQDVAQAVGDFVLHRADGVTAYQLAVVVDDAAQGITDVVRGEDLADNTPRQILLQQALGLPRPRYLHTPLVRAADGNKLSKQNGAEAVDLTDPLCALRGAAAVLDLPALPQTRLPDWLAAATAAWTWR